MMKIRLNGLNDYAIIFFIFQWINITWIFFWIWQKTIQEKERLEETQLFNKNDLEGQIDWFCLAGSKLSSVAFRCIWTLIIISSLKIEEKVVLKTILCYKEGAILYVFIFCKLKKRFSRWISMIYWNGFMFILQIVLHLNIFTSCR